MTAVVVSSRFLTTELLLGNGGKKQKQKQKTLKFLTLIRGEFCAYFQITREVLLENELKLHFGWTRL